MVDMSIQMETREDRGIPSVFCWTKMGAEAGQGLDAILRRKELERMAGNGSFAWGIGNSLGSSAHYARQQSPNGEIDVLFTPMKSAPKNVDTSPSQLFLWLYYETNSGAIKALPEHVLITSRGHEGKRSHYALLCHSSEEIAIRDMGGFHASNVRNLVSMNPVGASQVTAVVSYQENKIDEAPYRVSFRAKLHGEGFVKLIEPVLMNESLMMLYREACKSSSPSGWREAVNVLKQYVSKSYRQPDYQDEMFG